MGFCASRFHINSAHISHQNVKLSEQKFPKVWLSRIIVQFTTILQVSSKCMDREEEMRMLRSIFAGRGDEQTHRRPWYLTDGRLLEPSKKKPPSYDWKKKSTNDKSLNWKLARTNASKESERIIVSAELVGTSSKRTRWYVQNDQTVGRGPSKLKQQTTLTIEKWGNGEESDRDGVRRRRTLNEAFTYWMNPGWYWSPSWGCCRSHIENYRLC
jgi:hypothetical protein